MGARMDCVHACMGLALSILTYGTYDLDVTIMQRYISAHESEAWSFFFDVSPQQEFGKGWVRCLMALNVVARFIKLFTLLSMNETTGKQVLSVLDSAAAVGGIMMVLLLAYTGFFCAFAVIRGNSPPQALSVGLFRALVAGEVLGGAADCLLVCLLGVPHLG